MPLPFDRSIEQYLRILQIVRDWPAAVARMNREVDALVAGFAASAPEAGHG